MRDLRDLADGLDRAYFVVRVHDRDEDGFGRDGFLDLFGVHQTVAIYGEVRHGEALPFQVAADFLDGGVFDGRGDNVTPSMPVAGRDAFDRVVVGFGAAAGKHHSARFATEQSRDLSPSSVHAISHLDAEGVAARRIAEAVPDVRHHRVGDLWVDGRGRVIVEVDAGHVFLPAAQMRPTRATPRRGLSMFRWIVGSSRSSFCESSP
mgnify:FL=1